MKYYTIQNNSILIAENEQALTRFYDNVLPLPEDYEDGKYIVVDGELVLNPNWEEEQAQKEHERLQALYMTRSDFFDGFILAFDLGQVELRAIIENILNNINITDVEIKVALNNFDNALNFYRAHTLFTLLNGVEIPISEGIILIFTPDIWDKFFDTKDYRELQKAIHEVKPEPTVEPEEEDESTTDNNI